MPYETYGTYEKKPEVRTLMTVAALGAAQNQKIIVPISVVSG
ncbi:hypothetical protein ACWCXB_14240 [Streptomyces sp. NPDC001514]